MFLPIKELGNRSNLRGELSGLIWMAKQKQHSDQRDSNRIRACKAIEYVSSSVQIVRGTYTLVDAFVARSPNSNFSPVERSVASISAPTISGREAIMLFLFSQRSFTSLEVCYRIKVRYKQKVEDEMELYTIHIYEAVSKPREERDW